MKRIMKRNMNEGFGDMMDKIKNKAYDLYDKSMGFKKGPYTSIKDCVEGNGWRLVSTVERGKDYVVKQCVRTSQNSAAFGNDFEDLIDAVNDYLSSKSYSWTASDASDDYDGFCIRIGKDAMPQDGQTQQLAEIVAKAVKASLSEIYTIDEGDTSEDDEDDEDEEDNELDSMVRSKLPFDSKK